MSELHHLKQWTNWNKLHIFFRMRTIYPFFVRRRQRFCLSAFSICRVYTTALSQTINSSIITFRAPVNRFYLHFLRLYYSLARRDININICCHSLSVCFFLSLSLLAPVLFSSSLFPSIVSIVYFWAKCQNYIFYAKCCLCQWKRACYAPVFW